MGTPAWLSVLERRLERPSNRHRSGETYPVLVKAANACHGITFQERPRRYKRSGCTNTLILRAPVSQSGSWAEKLLQSVGGGGLVAIGPLTPPSAAACFYIEPLVEWALKRGRCGIAPRGFIHVALGLTEIKRIRSFYS